MNEKPINTIAEAIVQAIVELNRLWRPIRPYLAQQVEGLYPRHDGDILEAGPFSGLIFELACRGIGTSFRMAVFPREIIAPLTEEARELGLEERIAIAGSDEALSGVPVDGFDLIVFRGAFFFPTFFTPDLTAIHRSLKTGGVALLGGGFGECTPKHVIQAIEKRSKELNRVVGRVRVTEADLWSTLEKSGLEERATMITNGGLWVLLRK